MGEYFFMFIDTIFGFFALFVLVKFLGKSQLNTLTPFDFISAIILGELVGNALFEKKAGITEMAFIMVLWGLLLYITEMISQKYKGSRAALEGQPSIIIHRGYLMYDALKKNRLDLNQLQHLLRSKDVFSLEEVEYAVFETDGTISVLKKSDYQTPTKSDINIPPSPVKLATTVISDGEIVWDNLKEAKLTEQWLINELKQQNVYAVEEIFYAEWQGEQQKLFVMPYYTVGKGT
ncbi:YetF domain-containing protein [Lentibacillus juripiscarius]|uniref:YetF domain-containing protein n=1 Tax=Lentibacillus juripiscarius TaxID=257446 RepID=A0ABW5V5D1_9BACI